MTRIVYKKGQNLIKCIERCKFLSDLIEYVKHIFNNFNVIRILSKVKADLEKVYEDYEWVVYIPHNHTAAKRLGKGTKWHIAFDDDYYYSIYSAQGPIYINIRKSDNAKFQFHFETRQFVNVNEGPVRLNEIRLSNGIIGFYTKIDPMFNFRLNFDDVGNFIDGFAAIKLDNKYNFITTEGQLLSQQWFDWANVSKYGFAEVNLNGKCNFINAKGEFLSNQWFTWVGAFKDGFVDVNLNGKYNFINTEGHVLSQLWFDDVLKFKEGFAVVILNDKCNYINTEGHLLSKQWFDTAWNFKNGFATVNLNSKYNFITTKGQLLSKQWFDNVWDFAEGLAEVKLNGKYNFINAKGQFLSEQWFIWAGEFENRFAEVKLNGKRNRINAKGQLLPPQ